MHELEITRSLVHLALDEAKKANARKLTVVNVVLGEMSGAVDDSVAFYFELMTKDTIGEGAKIIFRKVPMQAKCRNCESTVSPKDIFWECEKCHSMDIEMTAGKELYIESIEVD
ncbi:MAG: hydrogenase maturation nickel metallochaperone HypA [Dehalococcoidales bacterium]|nr:hydrogenase maturation nickel metallochaperone HypA [Dehalococcoidales bacterium]